MGIKIGSQKVKKHGNAPIVIGLGLLNIVELLSTDPNVIVETKIGLSEVRELVVQTVIDGVKLKVVF